MELTIAKTSGKRDRWQGINWPLAEQRLHSNDPRSLGSSSLLCSLLSKVANDKFMTKLGYFETDKRV